VVGLWPKKFRGLRQGWRRGLGVEEAKVTDQAPKAFRGLRHRMARQKLVDREIAKRKREGRYHDGRRPLTAKIVQRLKGEGRYKDGLLPGLYLQVSGTGTKSWLLRFEINGRERWMGLGAAAIFGLKEARLRARAARQQLSDGIDPLQAKRTSKTAAKLAAAKKLSFREAATRYAAQHEGKWSNASYRAQFMSSLQAYAFATIGDMDVAQIDVPDVLHVIQPIWSVKTRTASRVRRRIEDVLDWATVCGHRPRGDNPARWRGHLDQVLPKVRQIAPVTPLKALPYSELPDFMAESRKREGIAARALQFCILTAARVGEVINAEWSEIDFANATWAVPAAKMKTRKEHRVPLVPEVVALLRELPREQGNNHVFIGSTAAGGFSRVALGRVVERMGVDATVHGFRSAFSTWAYERTSHSAHVVETALAHVVGSEAERAYRRSDLFEKRRRLMQEWAAFCGSPVAPPASAEIVPIRK
jgi:integrase